MDLSEWEIKKQMFLTFNFWGREIPIYGLLAVCGAGLGVLYLLIPWKVKKIKFEDLLYVYVNSTITAMIGAKLLYLIIEFKNIVKLLGIDGIDKIAVIKAYLSGGFVFYGGLIGAIAGAWLSCKYFGFKSEEMFDVLTPVLALVHGVGRIGCHLVGCCYGRETTGRIHVIYTDSAYAPNGVLLVPVQMMEACFEFLMCIVLTIFVIKGIQKGRLMKLYIICYAIFRFILEYFRGDALRGKLLCFSTSQWISLILLCIVFASEIKKKSFNKKIGEDGKDD